jgi:hypothetical protein
MTAATAGAVGQHVGRELIVWSRRVRSAGLRGRSPGGRGLSWLPESLETFRADVTRNFARNTRSAFAFGRYLSYSRIMTTSQCKDIDTEPQHRTQRIRGEAAETSINRASSRCVLILVKH